jgi:HSP20 family protein
MAVVKWDPLRDLLSIQDRMNKLFEQTLSRSRGEEAITPSTWTPAVDVYETPETIVMKADLPGLSREHIEIQIRDNTLTLKGERRFAKEAEEETIFGSSGHTGPSSAVSRCRRPSGRRRSAPSFGMGCWS